MITFIVPSFNQGSFIKYTIDSILLNMTADDHLIIADGGSSDSTAQVVSSYLSDLRVEWFSERDRGFSDAVTKALRLAKNPIVGIMSSDDAYKPNIRNTVLSCFEDPNVALAYADYELIDSENRRIGERRHKKGSLTDVMSLRVLLPQSSVFFRKSALSGLSILGIEHDYIADVVLFNQVCMRGKFCFRPEIWSEVRKHGASRTGRRNPGIQYIQALQTLFADLPSTIMRKALAGGLLLKARYQASSGQRASALGSLVSALLRDGSIVSHWLFLRSLSYIIFGPRFIHALEPMRRTVRGSARTGSG